MRNPALSRGIFNIKHMKSLASLDTEEYTKYLYNLKYKFDDPKLSEEEKQPTEVNLP